MLIDTICDTPLDPYAIDTLYADLCPCGADKADDAVFCPDCRGQHENLLSRTVASWPAEAARIRATFQNECRACGGAHPIQKCPQIRALLFAPIVERVIERAAA